MESLKKLTEDELHRYSEIIVDIAKMLSGDKDFARKFIMEPNTPSRYLKFPTKRGIVTFDRSLEEWSFQIGEKRILIDSELFHDLIYYV